MSQPSVSSDDRPMGATYAAVIACHLAVITILWLVGRTFSH
jgi:hypothetical protein